MLRALITTLLLAACATPQKVECACSCPAPAPTMPPWPEYGDRMPRIPSPFVPSLAPCPDGGSSCFIFVPTGAL